MVFLDATAADRDDDQAGQQDRPGVQHLQNDSVPI